MAEDTGNTTNNEEVQAPIVEEPITFADTAGLWESTAVDTPTVKQESLFQELPPKKSINPVPSNPEELANMYTVNRMSREGIPLDQFEAINAHFASQTKTGWAEYLRQQEARDKMKADSEALVDWARKNFVQHPAFAVNALTESKKIDIDRDAGRLDLTAPEAELMDTLNQANQAKQPVDVAIFNKEWSKLMATRNFFAEVAEDVDKRQGLGNALAYLGANAIIPYGADETRLAFKAIERAGIYNFTVGDVASPQEGWNKVINALQKMPSDRKRVALEALASEIKDMNPWFAQRIVDRLGRSNDELDQWLDRLSTGLNVVFAPYSLALKMLTTGAAKIAAKTMPYKVADNAGRPDVAASTLRETLEGKNVSGATREQAIDEAFSLNRSVYETTGELKTSTLSKSVQDELINNSRTFQELIGSITRGEVLTEAEKTAEIAKLGEKYSHVTNPNIVSSSVAKSGVDSVTFNVVEKVGSREAAEAMVKELYDNGIYGAEIVSDTTKPVFKPSIAAETAKAELLEVYGHELRAEKRMLETLVKDIRDSSKTQMLDDFQLSVLEQAQDALKILTKSKLSEEDLVSYGHILDGLNSDGVAIKGITNKMIDEAQAFGEALNSKAATEKFVYGRSIDKSVRNLVEKWSTELGLNRRVLVFHPDDVPNINAKYPGFDAYSKVNSFDKALRGAMGVAFRLDHNTTGIMLAKHLSGDTKYFTTIAHELGHAMYFEAIAKDAALAGKLENTFIKWAASKRGMKSQEYIANFRTPDMLMDMVNGKPVMTKVNWKEEIMYKAEWYNDAQEWLSENVAKYLFTDAKAVSDIEKFFKAVADKLKVFYREVAKVFGKGAAETDAMIKPLLQEFISTLKNPTKAINEEIRALMHTELKSSVRPGKPHIKLKPASSPSEEFFVKYSATENYTTANVGMHSTVKGYSWLPIDPKQTIPIETYAGRLSALYATEREKVLLKKWFDSGTKGLSRKDQRAVWQVLAEGDAISNQGKIQSSIFTPEELASKGMSEAQMKMYYTVRELRDYSYYKHNDVIVKDLNAKGFKNYLTTQGFASPAKAFDDASLAKQEFYKGNDKAKDVATGNTVELSSERIDDLYNNGYKLVRTYKENDGWQHFIVHQDDKANVLKNLTIALPYRANEFSRVYKDPYFIRTTFKKVVDGKETDVSMTFRTASSMNEANEFVDATKAGIQTYKSLVAGGISHQQAIDELSKGIGKFRKPEEFIQAIKEGEIPLDSTFTVKFNREKEDLVSDLIDEHITNGRLFESKRGSKLLSVYQDKVNTRSVNESLGIELNVISAVSNLDTWRRFSIQRYLNTFVEPRHLTNNPVEDLQKAPIKYGLSSEEYTLAQREREYILNTLRTQTKHEQIAAARGRRVVEWIEGLPIVGKPTEALLTGLDLRSASPTRFLKTVNFHLNLGMFNIAQLLVQGNGIAVAASMHPVFGAKAAYQAIPLRMALMSDNPEVWATMAKAHGKMSKEATEDFVKVVEAVRKSGLLDSINSTAYYTAHDGVGSLWDDFGSKAAKISSAPFNRGEEFARLTTWDIARREWMAANPKADWTTNTALDAIRLRADDYTLGMTRANIAWWQQGALGIPTQFLQYNIKFASELIRSGVAGRGVFTREQAMKAMLGSMFLYGTSGNGIQYVSDALFPSQEEQNSIPESVRIGISQGAVAAALNAVSDGKLDLAVGSRLGTFNWYEESFKKMWEGETALVDVLFGVTKSTFTKSIDVLSTLGHVWSPKKELTSEEFVEGLRVLSTMSSSLSNVQKMLIMQHNQGHMMTNGKSITSSISPEETWFKILGIDEVNAKDYYYMMSKQKSDDKEIASTAKEIRKLQAAQMDAILREDYKVADRYAAAVSLLLTENPYRREKLLKAAQGEARIGDQFEHIKRKLRERGMDVFTATSDVYDVKKSQQESK